MKHYPAKKGVKKKLREENAMRKQKGKANDIS
jgi:hypothetical protein